MADCTYRITVLGCRVNHAEARDLESVLQARGLRAAEPPEPVDLEVIHTCSVTGPAAAKSRQAIRRALHRGPTRPVGHVARHEGESFHAHTPAGPDHHGTPAPHVLVTGCFAGSDPAEAEGLIGTTGDVLAHTGPGTDDLIERFARCVDRWLSGQAAPASIRTLAARGSSPPPVEIVPLPLFEPPARPGRHVRAELRVQDGCDAHCTFCIIPSLRPRLRSKPVATAVQEARRLVDLGHRELVLTGIFLGAYGHETALRRRQRHRFAHPLADLLDAVARVPGLQRVRLSSLEPGDMTQPLLEALRANRPVTVPHLHLPLQSGSDAILRRMNRQYRVGAYLDMIDRVNADLTDEHGLPPAITTDIICGFPGETDEDFHRTAAVARRVGYLHMHVFPFSPRAGTAAARWRDRFVPPETARSRVRRLIALEADPGEGLSIRFRRRLVGRTVRVILEQPDRSGPDRMKGRCDHYALVSVPTNRPRGTLVHVRIDGAEDDRVFGTPESVAVALPVLR